jgi:hypothetical protein
MANVRRLPYRMLALGGMTALGLVPISVSSWSSDGVTSSDPEEFVDIHQLRPKPETKTGAQLPLVSNQVPKDLEETPNAKEQQQRGEVVLCSGLGTLIEWILKVLEGQAQIARVQFVAEEDSS